MKSFLFRHWRPAAVVAAVFCAWWLLRGGPPDRHPAPRILPEHVTFYAEVSDWPRFGELLPNLPLWSDAPGGERVARHIRDTLARRVAPFFGNAPEGDVRAFFARARSVSLALVRMREPTWVLVLETPSTARLERMLERDFSLPGETVDVEGLSARVHALPGARNSLWTLRIESMLVLAWSPEQDIVRHIVRTHRGTMVPLMAGREFETRRARLPQGTVAFCYGSAGHVLPFFVPPDEDDRKFLDRMDIVSAALVPDPEGLRFRGSVSFLRPFDGVFPAVARAGAGIPDVSVDPWLCADLRFDLSRALAATGGRDGPPRDARKALSTLDRLARVPLAPVHAFTDGAARFLLWHDGEEFRRALVFRTDKDYAVDDVVRTLSARIGPAAELPPLTVTRDGGAGSPIVRIGQYGAKDFFIHIRGQRWIVADEEADLAEAVRHLDAGEAPAPPAPDDPALMVGQVWPGRFNAGGTAGLIDPGARATFTLAGDANAIRFRGTITPAPGRTAAPKGRTFWWWAAVLPFLLVAGPVVAFVLTAAVFAVRYWLDARRKGVSYQKIVPDPAPLPDDTDALLAPRQRAPADRPTDSGDHHA